MKRKSLIIAAMFVAAISVYASSLWIVKKESVKIEFELPDEGTKGSLSGLTATIDFDEKDLKNSKITASVQTKSLFTGNAQKDEHLKSADFFNVEKFPEITFVSTKIFAGENGFVAQGNLTIKDSVKVIQMPFLFEKTDDGGILKGTASILSSDFGIMKKSKSGKDKVNIKIEVPVTK